MIEEALTEKIIGCAYDVYNSLGSGFLESVYHHALLIALEEQGLDVKSEYPIKVLFRDKIVGNFFADLLVEDKIIIEIKAIDHLAKIHEIQIVNYLKATGLDVGLLINFGTENIQVKRKYRKPNMEK